MRRVDPDTLSQIEVVADARRPLLPYAALVLEHIVRIGRAEATWCSRRSACARGCCIRCSTPRSARRIALLAAAQELNVLRSRSPQHGEELIEWTDGFMATSGIDETAEEKRLRHAACLLADIGWRAHPDYRGEQSLNIIAHAAFVGVDHPGRAFLALAIFFRHVGLLDDETVAAPARTRLDPHARPRARARRGDAGGLYGVGLAARRAAAHAAARSSAASSTLRLDGKHAALAGERLFNRLRQLARLVGREPAIVAD